jgi:hypothetical protein
MYTTVVPKWLLVVPRMLNAGLCMVAWAKY